MTWLTWRQQRTEFLITIAVLATCALALTATRILMGYDYAALGQGCENHPATALCDPTTFDNKWGGVPQFLLVFYLVPIVAAMFIAAPLVSGEVEHGTHYLIWTQGVTRSRWIAIKLAWIVGGGLLVGAGLSLLVSWWRQPFDKLAGTSMAPFSFDQEGTITVGVFLFALALGIAASALLRRTLPAMAVLLFVFAVVRLGVVVGVPHLMPTVTLLPFTVNTPIGSDAQVPVGLTVGQYIVDVPCPPQSPANETCQADAIQIVTDAYFWRLQLLETGIYVGLGGILLWLAFHWVRRRIT